MAETGNLAELLKTERESTQFKSDENFLIALAGLASGIEQVHNYTERKIDLELIGFHHDLRPRNILVSKTSFILADFGLSSFKETFQDSETPLKGGIGDYLAPECEDWNNGFQPGNVRRSSDIWSFGCIIAEIAAYMILGPKAVSDFREAREHKVRGFLLYQFHRGSQTPSDIVEAWLSRLETSDSTVRVMLIRLVRSILSIHQSERPKAKEVAMKLRVIALSEVATNVDDLFCEVGKSTSLINTSLEHMRFKAWMYATGLSRKIDLEQPARSYNQTLSGFGVTLKCLHELREDLESRIGQEQSNLYLGLSRLWDLNDQLNRMLDQEQQERARTHFNICILGSKDIVDERREDQDHLALDNEVDMRTTIKTMIALMANPEFTPSTRMIDSSAVILESPHSEHCLGSLKSGKSQRPILVEWRSYRQPEALNNVNFLSYKEIIHDRVATQAQLLSQEKPEAFRTLKCCGFFNNSKKEEFGVLFELPQSMTGQKSCEATSLRKQVDSTTGKSKLLPDLDDRFKLAFTLAASLLELHIVGWLHKNLVASNVIFFHNEANLLSRAIQDPYLIGFNHSRPGDPTAFTEGLADSTSKNYQHPMYLREKVRYQPEFDYYSLGVILIEIGFWMPFSKVTEGYKGSYEERRQKLLADRIPRLKQTMGRNYSAAVEACIGSIFGRSELELQDEVNPQNILLRFSEQVVSRLKKCCI